MWKKCPICKGFGECDPETAINFEPELINKVFADKKEFVQCPCCHGDGTVPSQPE